MAIVLYCYTEYKMHKDGFTLVELMITVAIITILLSVIVIGYRDFNSASSIKFRAFDIVENIRLAQASSSAAFLTGDGYEFVGLKIREGRLEGYGIGRAQSYTSFVQIFKEDNSIDEIFKHISSYRGTSIQRENYYVNHCFIYLEDGVTVDSLNEENGKNRCELNSSLETTIVPALKDYDVLISIQNPTEEPAVTIFPYTEDQSDKYDYANIYPSGIRFDGSNIGFRMLISDSEFGGTGGRVVTIDMLHTGLVTIK